VRLKRAQSSVGTIAETRMMNPPIVGVAPFAAWVSGVPSRTTWWAARFRSCARIIGPTINDMSSAVTAAPTARNEM
jgi:hypothetical protein